MGQDLLHFNYLKLVTQLTDKYASFMRVCLKFDFVSLKFKNFSGEYPQIPFSLRVPPNHTDKVYYPWTSAHPEQKFWPQHWMIPLECCCEKLTIRENYENSINFIVFPCQIFKCFVYTKCFAIFIFGSFVKSLLIKL